MEIPVQREVSADYVTQLHDRTSTESFRNLGDPDRPIPLLGEGEYVQLTTVRMLRKHWEENGGIIEVICRRGKQRYRSRKISSNYREGRKYPFRKMYITSMTQEALHITFLPGRGFRNVSVTINTTASLDIGSLEFSFRIRLDAPIWIVCQD